MEMKSTKPVLLLFLLSIVSTANTQQINVQETPSPQAFPLSGNTVADILYDADDANVVNIAVHLLAEDIERVTERKAKVLSRMPETEGAAVLVGTIGKSRVIDSLIRSGKLDVSDIHGQWEAFKIVVIENPAKGIKQALVIAGSDPRGTAYGIFTLSESIGVSPWHFWADVPPSKKVNLYIPNTTFLKDAPAVRYRGIFLNDEGWGLEPWASKTFEPEVGNVGPKTYGKIFELLLRLRANYIWPAMHPGTVPFHQVPGNAACADDHAIVVGSSHCEPMLRNNVREWEKPKDQFNYITHPDTVLSYWEERVKERTSGESVYTIGMRGIHDGAIAGPKNQNERIETLETIFADQRELLAQYLGNGNPSRVAQMFCPYKEVLDDYQAGLRVPNDVTLVWPDDNFGYIRRFATLAERKRKGGLGVYYHLSYLGNPLAWLWIDTLPPALVWSEMTRAYEQGVRTLWVANVGDIKNNERTTEFFLNLAWNADRTDLNAPARFMHQTATRDFGPEYSDTIVNILQRLQAINFERKTEHLQWHYTLTPYKPTEYNESEIRNRLASCAELLKDSDALAARLPAEMHDAYFELIGYAVGITEAANERYFRSELARADIARNRSPDANLAAGQAAEKRVDQLTARYNNKVADGKWKHVVTENGVSPKDWRRFQRDITVKRPTPTPENVCPPALPKKNQLSHPDGAHSGDFVELNNVISIHPGHFTGRHDIVSGAGWCSIPNLGRSGSAITVLPSTAEITPDNAPSLEYRFYVLTGGDARIHVRLLPTHPLVPGKGLRLAVALDKGSLLPLSVTTGFNPKKDAWKQQVLANAVEVSTKLPSTLNPGWHTLRLIAVDAGVVVDRIVIDLGGLHPSYNGPEETRLP